MRQSNETFEKYSERLTAMTDRQLLGEVQGQFRLGGREPGADLLVAKILLEGLCEKATA